MIWMSQQERKPTLNGANKPLDPNYKPEHQSESRLPSVTRKDTQETHLTDAG